MSNEAKTRAALYQAEVRQLFLDGHWGIGRNQPGELVAVHAAYINSGPRFPSVIYGPLSGERQLPSTVFYLTARFKPVSITETRCTIGLVGYYIFKDPETKKQQLIGPYPANNEEMTKYVKKVMAKAEKKIGRDHPEYREP